jgi:hypothetical protein
MEETKSHLSVLRAVLHASLLLVLVVPSLHAQQPSALSRPPGVPGDYVITPFGWFHPSCVRGVASGDTVFADGRVQHADGTVDPAAPVCGYPSYTARGEIITSRSPAANGWIETAHTSPTPPPSTSFGNLTATWTVPLAPSNTSSSQLLVYFFPGLQQDLDAQNLIIQPVLGWNDRQNQGPANAWGIASWIYCTDPNITTHSTPRAVNPNDVIVGTISGSNCNPVTLKCSSWTITTQDQTTSTSTTLNVSNYDRKFNLAFEGALEAYNVNTCNQYPANGKLTFFDVALYDYNHNLISNPGWSWDPQYQYLDPQCWYGGQASPTQLTLYYGLYATPATLNFGHHYTDESPVYLTATVTNSGASYAPIVSIGQNLPAYFLVSSTTCGSTLGAGSSCSITVELDLANAPVGTIKKTMAIVYGSLSTAAQLNVPLVATVSCRYNCFGPVGGP